MLQNAEMNCG